MRTKPVKAFGDPYLLLVGPLQWLGEKQSLPFFVVTEDKLMGCTDDNTLTELGLVLLG